jgi:hypothetical protein
LPYQTIRVNEAFEKLESITHSSWRLLETEDLPAQDEVKMDRQSIAASARN